MREVLGSYRVAVETAAIVAVLVGVRALLWAIGVTGMSTTPLISSVISGGIFPDMAAARTRLIAIVTSLRADITGGNTRECQAAIENLSQTLEELEETDVPANYIVRLRSEQASLRKAALRIYHIQREEFLPSAKAMIMSIVVIIMLILLFTDMGGLLESLVTVGFLAFFFIYLLRLLNVIDKPFKAGRERTEDDVSLFLLTEFVIHAQTKGTQALAPEDLEAKAERLEERLAEVEQAHTEGDVIDAAAALEEVARPMGGEGVRQEKTPGVER
jgi:hypothetical protein